MRKSGISREKDYENEMRLLSRTGKNNICADCHQIGVTYVNTTVNSFTCTGCSTYLRGLFRPHRVKALNFSRFKEEEVTAMKNGGNEKLNQNMLAKYDGPMPPCKTTIGCHITLKYDRKEWAKVDSSQVQQPQKPKYREVLVDDPNWKVKYFPPPSEKQSNGAGAGANLLLNGFEPSVPRSSTVNDSFADFDKIFDSLSRPASTNRVPPRSITTPNISTTLPQQNNYNPFYDPVLNGFGNTGNLNGSTNGIFGSTTGTISSITSGSDNLLDFLTEPIPPSTYTTNSTSTTTHSSCLNDLPDDLFNGIQNMTMPSNPEPYPAAYNPFL